jgi:hypothetical protein
MTTELMTIQEPKNEEKEESKNNQFESFDGEVLHPSLDIKNGVLSLGFRYRANPDEEKEIRIIVSDREIQAVRGEVFQIKNKLYYFETRGRKLMKIEERWSASELKKFIIDYEGLKAVIPLPKAFFDELVEVAKKHIELEQDIDYCLLIAWIIGSYFYPIFSAYPFLHIKAPKRSGKSQFLNFLVQTCFNAIKARPSLPALSDTVDSLRGTYLIDQADSLERKGGEELLDILADSYKKSGGKRRVINFDKKRGREILEFETYSPKAFASIRELPEDLRDRCLIVPLIRSQKNFPDPDDDIVDWRDVRGKIYKLLITEYGIINSTYIVKKINHRQKLDILGRSLEMWLPFEVILDCFGMQDKIKEGWARFGSLYRFSEYQPSEIEEAVIKAILQQLQNESEVVLTPKEISELVDNEFFVANDTPKQRAAKVGWAIKKFNLASEKKSRTKDGVRYLFEKAKVEGIFQSYFKSSTEPTSPTSDGSDGLITVEKQV